MGNEMRVWVWMLMCLLVKAQYDDEGSAWEPVDQAGLLCGVNLLRRVAQGQYKGFSLLD